MLNHVTHVDPLTAAHFVYDHGRLPRYLAKADLFKNKALSRFLRDGGQIPVERLSRNAVGAFDAAVAAVNAGECIVVYPEGTITRDPDLWPMTGKSGAARIALATGCPVIPVGHWGAHELLAPYSKKPDLFPRKKIIVKAGDPVDLGDLLDREPTRRSSRRRPTGSWRRSPRWSRTSAASRRPTERFDPRRKGRQRDRQPQARSATGVRMSKVAVLGAGSWGTAFSHGARRRRQRRDLWGRREEVCAAINEQRENAEYLPGIELPPAVSATHDHEKALHDADVVVLAVPSQTLRENLTVWAPYARPRRGDGLADEGRRAGHAQADERGDRRGHRRRPRTDRRDQRPQPGQGDRPPRAGRVGGRVRGRAGRQEAAGALPLAGVPSLHVGRRARAASSAAPTRTSSASRSAWPSGSGFGDNTTASVITRGLAETARLATRLGRQPAHADGPGRPRRPGRHLLLAAVAQPDVRREPRQGDEHRGDLRHHPPGRRGRQVVLLHPRPGASSAGIDAPIAEHVDEVVAGRLTATDMMDAFIARDTKAETD